MTIKTYHVSSLIIYVSYTIVIKVPLRILVTGERCNVTGEYFEGGSTSKYNIVIGYQTFAGELSKINQEFSDL